MFCAVADGFYMKNDLCFSKGENFWLFSRIMPIFSQRNRFYIYIYEKKSHICIYKMELMVYSNNRVEAGLCCVSLL